jgi:AcrR family transcriptional regulator
MSAKNPPNMKAKGQKNLQRILQSADNLIYHRGFNQTSFTDVAKASGIPKGNFYYYFKSKDELLLAVIDMRLENIRKMLAEWEQQYSDPKDRLKRYAQILLNEAQAVVRYGCPMGSLNVELGKMQQSLQAKAASMFSLFLEWLEQQFRALGQTKKRSHYLALHLTAMLQGTALISSVYGDVGFLQQELKGINTWIEEL